MQDLNQYTSTSVNLDRTEILNYIGLHYSDTIMASKVRSMFNDFISKLFNMYPDYTPEELQTLAREIIGYESANYDYAICKIAEKLLGIYHPILGPVDERAIMSDIVPLKAGVWIGKIHMKGGNWKNTLLYYPLRKQLGVTLQNVLDNPTLDALLGEVAVNTIKEQQEYDEKTKSFFDAFKYGNTKD